MGYECPCPGPQIIGYDFSPPTASSRSHFAPGSLLRITSPMYAPYADPSPFVLMEEGSFRYCSWRLPRISSTRLMESTHPDVPQRHSAIRLHVTQLHRRTQGR